MSRVLKAELLPLAVSCLAFVLRKPCDGSGVEEFHRAWRRGHGAPVGRGAKIQVSLCLEDSSSGNDRLPLTLGPGGDRDMPVHEHQNFGSVSWCTRDGAPQ